jgi:hypothetical protein
MARSICVASRLAAIFALAALLPVHASGQITRGTISGTVRDASGGVVPGAAVVVTNMDTNVARDTITDAQGFYRVSALDAGRYQVVVELAGFTTVEVKELQLRASSELSTDVVLKPAGVGEAITVTAESTTAQLAKTSPTIGFTTTSKAVVELPLSSGRDLNRLILTVPNAVETGGQGTFAVNGQRPRNNNYMIDGSDNNDASVTISTTQLPPEAVQEFQLVSNPYSVEFGRNTGGQVNIITKSGTNQLRGDVWDYYVSSDLYSLNNIEKASGLKKPARYNRHQAGFDLGGPALRDKTFFYGLYQYDPQRPGPTPGATVRVPTPAGYAALQNVSLGAGQTAASRSAVLERIRFLQDIYAQGVNFRNFSNVNVNGVPIETAQTNVNNTSPYTFKTYLARVDQRVGNNDNFTARYAFNDRVYANAISNCDFGPLFCGAQTLKDTNLAASNTHIFTSRLLNEFRFSWVRRDLDFPENDPVSPTAAISGLFTIGGLSNYPQFRVTDQFQFSNTLTWTRDRHTLKFGGDVRYNEILNGSDFYSKGSFTFSNLQDYMNNLAFQFQQAVNTASFEANQWMTSFYLQDDFRVTSELTLNMGIRYDLQTVPLGLFGATDAESLAALVPGPVQTDKNNWAPRVGFAYSPRSDSAWLGDGKTVIRGGFGMGYDVLFFNLHTVNGSNYPRVFNYLVNNVQNVYPNLLSGGGSATFDALNGWVNSAEDTELPESRIYSLGMQREVGKYLFEVGYTGSKGYKGINQIQMNPAVLTAAQIATVQAGGTIPGVQARRVFPQFGSRTVIPATVGPGGNDVEARSSYNALLISANKRYSDGLQFGVNYTFSRWFSNNDASLGEGGTTQSSQRPQSGFDYESEWSRSNFDRPHRFSANYLWEIPGPTSGPLSYVVGGWQVSGITSWQSGPVFTITTGVDTNGDGLGGTSDRPNINPSGSFTWDDDHRGFTNNNYYVAPRSAAGAILVNGLGDGNAPRNGERAASYWRTDLSLMKRFPVGPTRLMFRIDVFNVLNQDEYGAPNNQMNSANFGINGNNWGRRSAQISAKLSF